MGAFLFKVMSYVTNVPKMFKKKWFWIGFILLLLFAIIFDIVIASLVLFKSLSSGQWSMTLLALGFLYSVGAIYQKYIPKEKRRQVRWTGRLLLLLIVILMVPDYGFLKTLYFVVTIFIFSRFAGWIVGVLTRKRKTPKYSIIE